MRELIFGWVIVESSQAKLDKKEFRSTLLNLHINISGQPDQIHMVSHSIPLNNTVQLESGAEVALCDVHGGDQPTGAGSCGSGNL